MTGSDPAPPRSLSLGVVLGLMPLALLATVPAVAVASALGLGWMGGVGLVEASCFALPALLAARAEGDARASLGLVAPPARAVAGAVLVGVSFWYVNFVLIAPLLVDRVTESDRALAEAVTSGAPLWAKLLFISLVPAVCEELLVRGAIARGIAARAGLWPAVLASSAYFALMHLSLARAAPMVLLGAVLAVGALRAGSLVPAMLLHAINNGVTLLMSQPGLAGAARAIDRHATVAGLTAVLASATGIALLWASRPKSLVSDATSL